MDTINERIKKIVDTFASGKNTELAKALGTSEANIRNYTNSECPKMPKFDILRKIVTNFDVSSDWLLTGNGPMLRSNAAITDDPDVGVPYYDVDFIGGFNIIENDQTIVPAHNIIFKPYENATLWCNVTGNSMAEKINHGDIIALKKLESLDDIMFGEIYAVVLDTLRTVKILRKANDPAKFRFIPVNTAEYDEQEFDKSRIVQVYAVLGCIRKFF